MIERLISALFNNLVGILLSGFFLGFLAKIFRRSFIIGFVAGILPKILLPFIPFYFPYASFILPLALYFFFIWIFLRFGILISLILAGVTFISVTIGPAYLSKLLVS